MCIFPAVWVITLNMEIKPSCIIDGYIDFTLLQFIKHAFILQVSKNSSSFSVFFKIKCTWYIILHRDNIDKKRRGSDFCCCSVL